MRVCTRVCNQSRFGTLQEVINSQDYCADTMISKVLHNSLCGEGWLNQSTWKGERDVRFAASCRGPSASLSAPAVSLLCEEEGVWTSKTSHATLETETISKGSGERWHRGEPPFHDPQKKNKNKIKYPGIRWELRAALYSKYCIPQRGVVYDLRTLRGKKIFQGTHNIQQSRLSVNSALRVLPRDVTVCTCISHRFTTQTAAYRTGPDETTGR